MFWDKSLRNDANVTNVPQDILLETKTDRNQLFLYY